MIIVGSYNVFRYLYSSYNVFRYLYSSYNVFRYLYPSYNVFRYLYSSYNVFRYLYSPFEDLNNEDGVCDFPSLFLHVNVCVWVCVCVLFARSVCALVRVKMTSSWLNSVQDLFSFPQLLVFQNLLHAFEVWSCKKAINDSSSFVCLFFTLVTRIRPTFRVLPGSKPCQLSFLKKGRNHEKCTLSQFNYCLYQLYKNKISSFTISISLWS